LKLNRNEVIKNVDAFLAFLKLLLFRFFLLFGSTIQARKRHRYTVC